MFYRLGKTQKNLKGGGGGGIHSPRTSYIPTLWKKGGEDGQK